MCLRVKCDDNIRPGLADGSVTELMPWRGDDFDIRPAEAHGLRAIAGDPILDIRIYGNMPGRMAMRAAMANVIARVISAEPGPVTISKNCS